MVFTSQQMFTGKLDGTTADSLNKKLDRTLDSYEDRLNKVENILENTSFFDEYFDEYFNTAIGQSDYLSIDNNVCKTLENYATYLLNARDIEQEKKAEYKIYYDEQQFRKALNKEVMFTDDTPDVLDILMIEKQNYKKAKQQQITKKDLEDEGELGEVLRCYNDYLEYLRDLSLPGQKFKIDRIRGSVKKDMILSKDILKGVHGYNLRYFSESTSPDLDVIDFSNFKHLKGFSLDVKNKNYRAVDGLLRMKFNGDFQNHFQCILYDLEQLILKTPMSEQEEKVLKMYRKGLTEKKISDIIGLSRVRVNFILNSAIKKINKKALYLEGRQKWKIQSTS